MPEALSRGLEALLAQQENRGGSAPVRAAGAAISQRYRTRVGTGERLIRSDTEALAYAVSRMPATFAAVYDALEKADPHALLGAPSLLDVGTGTGAACWAAARRYELGRAVCLDADPKMLRTAGALFQFGPPPLRDARLFQCDASGGPLPARADLVVSAYMLGELPPPRRRGAAGNVGRRGPHASAGSARHAAGVCGCYAARALLLSWSAYLAAPCPHMGACPLPEKRLVPFLLPGAAHPPAQADQGRERAL